MKSPNAARKYPVPQTIPVQDRQWPAKTIAKAPIWCSVDLRDGNQSLPNPMSPEQKLEYFQLLCAIGFKHIEVAFPSASQDDFDFTRKLITDSHIPDDVFIMGLTQCREHLIDRTFESFKGLKRGIAHLYLATSELHMGTVFGLDKAKSLAMAVKAVRQTRQLADAMPESDIRLEFSPEEFTDTDLSFALEICEAVHEAWGKGTVEKPVILNLPATVERRPPNHYADMIEYFCAKFSRRRESIISLHSHNDQGMAVAATELALLAGADRVEGTLFGHGERTGNVDLVTFALNLESRGIDTGLDFTNLPKVVETVERLASLPVHARHPYAGELVFTAFSGSHQDAIRKGLHTHQEAVAQGDARWRVPYLHIDPKDLGRDYERIIRINSQSGKGGVAWILETDYGVTPPKAMHPELGRAVQHLADESGRELQTAEVWELFQKEFITPVGRYELVKYWPRPDQEDPTCIHGEVRIKVDGVEQTVEAEGNGPVSAFANAIAKLGVPEFSVDNFEEQAVGHGADAKAMAYVPLNMGNGKVVWGVGTGTNIDQAAVRAIMAGLNRMARRKA